MTLWSMEMLADSEDGKGIGQRNPCIPGIHEIEKLSEDLTPAGLSEFTIWVHQINYCSQIAVK